MEGVVCYMERKKCCAIVLAAGVGKRMKSNRPKQFMELGEKPVLYYSLKAFEESFIEEIVLVTGANDISYCKEEIVAKYGFKKIKAVVEGGAERYLSVYEGLKVCGKCDYVYIHDGARPFVDESMMEEAYKAVQEYGACVIAVKAKDTIKVADENGIVKSTPDRNTLWQMQTPQVFVYEMIKKAHEMILDRTDLPITDDAFVYECAFHKPIKLVEGKYENIKITTPEDMEIANIFLKKRFQSHIQYF